MVSSLQPDGIQAAAALFSRHADVPVVTQPFESGRARALGRAAAQQPGLLGRSRRVLGCSAHGRGAESPRRSAPHGELWCPPSVQSQSVGFARWTRYGPTQVIDHMGKPWKLAADGGAEDLAKLARCTTLKCPTGASSLTTSTRFLLARSRPRREAMQTVLQGCTPDAPCAGCRARAAHDAHPTPPDLPLTPPVSRSDLDSISSQLAGGNDEARGAAQRELQVIDARSASVSVAIVSYLCSVSL